MSEIMSTLSAWFDPETMGPVILLWGGRILSALAVFLIGRWLAAVAVGAVSKALGRARVEETLTRFLTSLVYMTLLIIIVLTAIGTLGVPTANFLAVLGAAGLAIGLALKDSLSNFSSGVMLVFFRPFKSGDYVEAAGVAGTVFSISIFNTVIKTPDNRVITVPNSLIYGDTITNYSAEATRRVDLVFGISYDDDVAGAKEIIKTVLDGDERILKDPPPQIMLLELADSSVNFAVRPWVASADYWSVRGALLESVKAALEQNGLSIPYPQRDLHIVSQAAGT
jgi:small conductance mechanosensitive channel